MNGEPAQPTANSPLKRVLIGLAWGLIQLMILSALFFWGMVAGVTCRSMSSPAMRPTASSWPASSWASWPLWP
jgi:hypothetical protein